MGYVQSRKITVVDPNRDVEFTTINVENDMENGMQMEYSAKHFKKMSIRTSTGETTTNKIKRKIRQASDYLARGHNSGY